jgi:hypothetical protein
MWANKRTHERPWELRKLAGRLDGGELQRRAAALMVRGGSGWRAAGKEAAFIGGLGVWGDDGVTARSSAVLRRLGACAYSGDAADGPSVRGDALWRRDVAGAVFKWIFLKIFKHN